MAANLTPQYKEAEQRYKQAKNPQDKLLALQEMLREIPKHKASEKMQADLKRKISEQKKSMVVKKAKTTTNTGHVDSHGHPQIVVIGAPNSGKSSLVSRLTGATLKIADYPFTTTALQPAIMLYQNVRIQLVDTPPVSIDHMDCWMPNVVRAANAVLLLADLANDDILDELEAVVFAFERQRIYLQQKPQAGKIGDMVKNVLLVANKCDSSDAREILELLDEVYREKFERICLSSISGEGVERLKEKCFALLQLVRIYSKPPGKKADQSSPILLKKGSSIVELAEHIHRDMAKNLKSARVWGNNRYTDGQRVPRNYLLADEDIIELIS